MSFVLKKVLLSLTSLLFVYNIFFVNAEEIEVLNNESTEVLESNENEVIENNETILNNENEVTDIKTYVALVDCVNYETLDEAISAAKDNDTITLLSNATTKGFELSKNLIIDGKNFTITFDDKGIALWGKNLTIKNATVNMVGVASTPYVEWRWMVICASTDASLTLDNVKMTTDANGKSAANTHVIYFCSNNKLTLNNSTLFIDGNKCTVSSKWTQPGELYIGGKDSIIEKSTKLAITNNNGSGIYIKKNASLNLEVGTITYNIAEKLTIGGGINNNGTLIMNSDVIINNNRAESEADDIYNAEGATITISNPNVDTKLEETRKDGKKLNDCTDKIDNWYDDSKIIDGMPMVKLKKKFMLKK